MTMQIACQVCELLFTRARMPGCPLVLHPGVNGTDSCPPLLLHLVLRQLAVQLLARQAEAARGLAAIARRRV